ncbi:MAG: hypothetical protein [Caudoviricetes sp.]|nr:MAG: hypothetical protein [Caudoviricetes sp.]
MKEFLVKYELNGYVYHSKIITDTSGAAMYWVMNAFPEAKEIRVISSVDV